MCPVKTGFCEGFVCRVMCGGGAAVMGTAAVLAWRGFEHRERSWWLFEYGISMVLEKGTQPVLVCWDKSKGCQLYLHHLSYF